MVPGYDIEETVVIHETSPGMTNEGALLVKAPKFGDDEVWIPKACITEDSEVFEKGTEGTLIVTEGWARKEGWI